VLGAAAALVAALVAGFVADERTATALALEPSV
jgi:hypothetical protein